MVIFFTLGCQYLYFLIILNECPTVSCAINYQKLNSTPILMKLCIRGGVKLEFIRNSFDPIQKFGIRLFQKVKNNSKNSIKINSKFVRFDWLHLTVNTLSVIGGKIGKVAKSRKCHLVKMIHLYVSNLI